MCFLFVVASLLVLGAGCGNSDPPTAKPATGKRLPREGKLELSLDPGSYALVSYQRTCDGNCGHLDAPSERCSDDFTLPNDRAVRASIRVRFGSGCEIRFP